MLQTLLLATSMAIVLTTSARSQDFVLEEVAYDGRYPEYLTGYFLLSDFAYQLLVHHEDGQGDFVYSALSCSDETNECLGETITFSKSKRGHQLALRLWFTPSLDAPDYVILNESIRHDSGLQKRRPERIFAVVYWDRSANRLGLNRFRPRPGE